MSVSQSSSLRAHCSVSLANGPAFIVNRGFASVTRLAGQATGVFVLSPDPNENGFDPSADTVTITPHKTFNGLAPDSCQDAYYSYSAIKPDGHRDLVIAVLQTDPAGGPGPGITVLFDGGFDVHVDTTK